MSNPDKEIKPIIYEVEYGTIRVNLDKILETRDLSVYEVNQKSNIRYQTLQALQSNSASRIDFEVLAKLCYALGCEVKDILEYIPNEKSKK